MDENKQKFENHLIRYNHFLRKAEVDFLERYKTQHFTSNALKTDFEFMKTIGKGSFGHVITAMHIPTNQVVAVKVIEKALVIKNGQQSHVFSEIRTMDAVRFEFLLHLKYYFQDNVYLYLVMPLINGGEMFFHLRNTGSYSESQARFYAAQVVLALEYLHYMGCVYRDLKPENILFDREGYLKLTDFGFVKRITEHQTYTLCGTPDYLAPEILLCKGYSYHVDWWSFGVLLYEMTSGIPPFYSKEHINTYDKIVKVQYQFPKYFSKQLRNLISNLLIFDRSKRYGCLKNGVVDIKGHLWFDCFDWDALLTRKIKAQYIPTCGSGTDISMFKKINDMEVRRDSKNEYPEEFYSIRIQQMTSVDEKTTHYHGSYAAHSSDEVIGGGDTN